MIEALSDPAVARDESSTALVVDHCVTAGWLRADLARHAAYTEAQLAPCVRDLHALHRAASGNKLQAVLKKYAQEKHGCVSDIPVCPVI